MDRNIYDACVDILKRELIPALGCTEPISIAYATAKAREVLGGMPSRIDLACSGNIIKNVKGVIVPGTGHLRGAEVSAVLGALAGDSSKMLEVLSNVTHEDAKEAQALVETGICTVRLLEKSRQLHIIATLYKNDESAMVEIKGGHLNIVKIMHNDDILQTGTAAQQEDSGPDYSVLNLAVAYQFARELNPADVQDVLQNQAQYNMAIAKEGLENEYGACVGACLMDNGTGVDVFAKAMAAAASDARMSGCSMPVVINSGSGNQGLTASLPVLVYAKHLNATQDQTLRALALSNLIAIHIKNNIGRLSAFCGAVSAACGCGAGIAFLEGAGFSVICDTVTNTLANVAGIVCDGAKPSCAAKIASSVDASLMAYHVARKGHAFGPDEGICGRDAEETIKNTVRMAKDGMRQTDLEILHIMTGT